MMDFDELDEREGLVAQAQPQDRCSAGTYEACGDVFGVRVRCRVGPEYSSGVRRSAAKCLAATRATARAKAGRPSPREPAAERAPAAECEPAAEEQEPAGAGIGAPPPQEEEAEEEQEEEAPPPEEPAVASPSPCSAESGCVDAEGSAAAAGDDLPAATGVKLGSAEGAKPILPEVKHKDASKDTGDSVSTSSKYFNPKAWERLDRRCGEIPGVNTVAAYLNVSPLTVAVAGSISAVAFLLHGFGGQMVCTLLGCLYPAFESFKAAESSQPSVMQFWLMYWVVWSLLATVEQFFWVLLIWVPFYYPLKLVALMWLFHPATRGARFVYQWFLLPSLQRNQERIDAALEESTQQIKRGISGALSGAVGAGLNTALAAGGGVVPRVRSLSGLLMEAVLSKRSSPLAEQGD